MPLNKAMASSPTGLSPQDSNSTGDEASPTTNPTAYSPNDVRPPRNFPRPAQAGNPRPGFYVTATEDDVFGTVRGNPAANFTGSFGDQQLGGGHGDSAHPIHQLNADSTSDHGSQASNAAPKPPAASSKGKGKAKALVQVENDGGYEAGLGLAGNAHSTLGPVHGLGITFLQNQPAFNPISQGYPSPPSVRLPNSALGQFNRDAAEAFPRTGPLFSTDEPLGSGTPSSAGPSRFMVIRGYFCPKSVDQNAELDELLQYPEVREATGANWHNTDYSSDLYLFFENIESAAVAQRVLLDYIREKKDGLLRLHMIGSDEYCRHDIQGAAVAYDSEYAGQVLAVVTRNQVSDAPIANAFNVVLRLAGRYGRVRTHEGYGVMTNLEVQFRLEFECITDATRFINLFQEQPFEAMDFSVFAEAFVPPDHRFSPIRGSTILGTALLRGYRPEQLEQFTVDSGDLPLRFNGIIGAKVQPEQTEESDASRVILSQILNGRDIRTTIMLRNIPSNVNAFHLREILMTVAWKRYDFSYLRIDFFSGCNVGYAFINFSTPMDVLNFVQNVSGRCWALFDPSKVAQVSYASNQGVQCSIENSRNSAVMRNWTWNRPKLWYPEPTAKSSNSSPNHAGPSTPTSVYNAAYAGTERPFEPPNNATKLSRSLENVQNNGLFGPTRVSGSHSPVVPRPSRTSRMSWGRRTVRAPAHMWDNGNPNAPADDRENGYTQSGDHQLNNRYRFSEPNTQSPHQGQPRLPRGQQPETQGHSAMITPEFASLSIDRPHPLPVHPGWAQSPATAYSMGHSGPQYGYNPSMVGMATHGYTNNQESTGYSPMYGHANAPMAQHLTFPTAANNQQPVNSASGVAQYGSASMTSNAQQQDLHCADAGDSRLRSQQLSEPSAQTFPRANARDKRRKSTNTQENSQVTKSRASRPAPSVYYPSTASATTSMCYGGNADTNGYGAYRGLGDGLAPIVEENRRNAVRQGGLSTDNLGIHLSITPDMSALDRFMRVGEWAESSSPSHGAGNPAE